mmetsp:Transcript_5566/g.17563  ORF Transcript_5566/g.17563 Transcript_5566/m.17563 type:complete len:603 (-) Transcript_5566:558-2366(-)
MAAPGRPAGHTRGGGGGGGAEGVAVDSMMPAVPAPVQPGAPPPAPAVVAAPVARPAPTGTHTKHLSATRFDQLPVSPLTIRGITEILRYECLTAVQEATLPVVLQGLDVIAKAKTGTGKTTGFLLPSVEVLVRARAKDPAAASRSVGALIIAPTRELSFQIKKECDELLTFHRPHLASLSVTGGTNIAIDLKHLRNAPPSILVATPGRLKDLLLNYGLAPLFAGLKILVFDEADQLLDMGFRPDITRILQAIEPSRQTRQTLLYSATLPKDVLEIGRIATRGNAQLVDTVGHEETQTNAQVEQSSTVSATAAQPAELLALIRQLTGSAGYKIVVFFTTARLTQLYSELFEALGFSILEMHSRKSQPHRNRMADLFKTGTNLIMFSSDVSARGMDYPDVTAVVQLGLPSEKAQYIHRLGRTARAGKDGGGYLLLADFEAGFLRQLGDLPIATRPPLTPAQVESMEPAIRTAFASLPVLTQSSGYQAYLGFYNSHLKRLSWSREECVARANEFAYTVLGLASPPPLEAKTIGKMGLKGVAGLVIAPKDGGGGGGGGRKGGGKGGGGGRGGGGAGLGFFDPAILSSGPPRGGKGKGGGRGGRGGY